MKKMAILVCSCDKYEDVWDPMFEMFFKFWEDCPFDIYLLTNEKTYDHNRVKTITTGEDLSWSRSFRKALEHIQEEYVLIIMEDYILKSKVQNEDFYLFLSYMQKNAVDYFRIFPSPRPTIYIEQLGEFGVGGGRKRSSLSSKPSSSNLAA